MWQCQTYSLPAGSGTHGVAHGRRGQLREVELHDHRSDLVRIHSDGFLPAKHVGIGWFGISGEVEIIRRSLEASLYFSSRDGDRTQLSLETLSVLLEHLRTGAGESHYVINGPGGAAVRRHCLHHRGARSL